MAIGVVAVEIPNRLCANGRPVGPEIINLSHETQAAGLTITHLFYQGFSTPEQVKR